MKIQDEHLYHGAALIQIAEDERFTAINALTFGKVVVPSAYKINDSIGVYFKYGSQADGRLRRVCVFLQGHADPDHSQDRDPVRRRVHRVGVC